MEKCAFFEKSKNNKVWTRRCRGFIVEIIKGIVKEKQTLTFCVTKKRIFLSEVRLA
jgi:hypothetical protein